MESYSGKLLWFINARYIIIGKRRHYLRLWVGKWEKEFTWIN
jgi:hypothetical protein